MKYFEEENAEKIKAMLDKMPPSYDKVEGTGSETKLIPLPMSGADQIKVERERQINEEGWTAEHDDKHAIGELAKAAACYAVLDCSNFVTLKDGAVTINIFRLLWPWHRDWWKPSSRIRNLVKAGALIAAEIDRLQREKFREEDNGRH